MAASQCCAKFCFKHIDLAFPILNPEEKIIHLNKTLLIFCTPLHTIGFGN